MAGFTGGGAAAGAVTTARIRTPGDGAAQFESTRAHAVCAGPRQADCHALPVASMGIDGRWGSVRVRTERV